MAAGNPVLYLASPENNVDCQAMPRFDSASRPTTLPRSYKSCLAIQRRANSGLVVLVRAPANSYRWDEVAEQYEKLFAEVPGRG